MKLSPLRRDETATGGVQREDTRVDQIWGTRFLVFRDVVTAAARSRATKATTLREHCFTLHIDEELKHLAQADLEDKIFLWLLGSEPNLRSCKKPPTSSSR